MEHLAAYLRDRKKGDFARSLDIKPVYLSQILGGVRKPSLRLATLIEERTGGEVPASSWFKNPSDKKGD